MDVSRIGSTSLQEEYVLKLWNEYINETLVETTPCEIGIYEWKHNKTIAASRNSKYLLKNCKILRMEWIAQMLYTGRD
jgi:hypothetical protein